jgi:hypothetical protein
MVLSVCAVYGQSIHRDEKGPKEEGSKHNFEKGVKDLLEH